MKPKLRANPLTISSEKETSAKTGQGITELELTRSLCPVCLKLLTARIVTDEASVCIEKTCSEHGSFKSLVWSDLESYLWSFRFTKPPTPYVKNTTRSDKGCPFDCGLCPEHKQHTCLAVLEVTGNCNLSCFTCLASSGKDGQVEPTLEEVRAALLSLLTSEGRPTPLQLSGGEPTIRPDLDEIIREARNLGFRFVEVNTNGINLARKPELAQAYADAGLDGIYLQFDGVTDDVYRRIRGIDMTKIKAEAIASAQNAGLNIVLAATVVKGINDHQLWEIIDYALKNKLNGVNFQPFAMQGRYPRSQLNPLDKITNPDIARLIEAQSGGRLRAVDFLPIPCPDHRCQLLCYLAIDENGVIPVNRLIEAEGLLEYYRNFTDADQMENAVKDLKKTLHDMWSGSAVPGRVGETCCNLPLPRANARFFPISCHGMMDVWNMDINRLKRCCVHELTLNGELIPFCLYNCTSVEGQKLYRDRSSPT